MHAASVGLFGNDGISFDLYETAASYQRDNLNESTCRIFPLREISRAHFVNIMERFGIDLRRKYSNPNDVDHGCILVIEHLLYIF